MAKLELPRRTKLKGIYWVEVPTERLVPVDNPMDTLRYHLSQFIGLPNTEQTRASIQHVLNMWNFTYGEHLTMDDLNLQ